MSTKGQEHHQLRSKVQPVEKADICVCDQDAAGQIMESVKQPVDGEAIDFDGGGLLKATGKCTEDIDESSTKISGLKSKMLEENERFLRILRQAIVDRILETIETKEREKWGRLSPPSFSKGRILWARLRDRLSYAKDMVIKKGEELQRQKQRIEQVLRKPLISTRREIHPRDSLIHTRELIKRKGMLHYQPSMEGSLIGSETDVYPIRKIREMNKLKKSRELDKQEPRKADHREEKGKFVFTIRGKRATSAEAVLSGTKEELPSVLSSRSPTDSHSTLKEYRLPDPNEQFTSKKSRLFEFLESSDDKNLVTKAPVERTKQIKNVPEKIKLFLKRRSDPKHEKIPLNIPIFTSDTLDQISWSEFNTDGENEVLRNPRAESINQTDAAPRKTALITSPKVKLSRSYSVKDGNEKSGDLSLGNTIFTSPVEYQVLSDKGSTKSPLDKTHFLVGKSDGRASQESSEILEPPRLSFRKKYSINSQLKSTDLDTTRPVAPESLNIDGKKRSTPESQFHLNREKSSMEGEESKNHKMHEMVEPEETDKEMRVNDGQVVFSTEPKTSTYDILSMSERIHEEVKPHGPVSTEILSLYPTPPRISSHITQHQESRLESTDIAMNVTDQSREYLETTTMPQTTETHSKSK